MVPPSEQTLAPFVAHCLRRNLPFELVELTGDTPLDPAAGPLVAVSGRFMERALQQRLARFATEQALLLVGEPPVLDEDLRPWSELADAAARAGVRTVPVDGQPIAAALDQWLGDHSRPGAWLELRRTTAADVLVFLFNRLPEPLQARTACGENTVTVDLVSGGCAVVHVSHGRLNACYVKGVNEQTGAGVPVYVRVGPDLLSTDRPCDLSAVHGPGGFEVRTSAQARVVLPERP
jgi:beta-galactosidase